ncbi:uncharacterized protein LOC127012157 [Drosophila biarmipes]|uniref:uncharacterized protein LOC127012157 n=1 Tax=Drosophila biarmipes TaxID=125945 RepID=UPI0021CCC5D3|nr:uncharacterized protein LOC127012157 [Drosophila biarmipes]
MDKFLATKIDDKNNDVSTTTKPKKPLVSEVWTFFTLGTGGTARSNICSKTYRTSGNTSNLKDHLTRKPPEHKSLEIPVPKNLRTLRAPRRMRTHQKVNIASIWQWQK